MPHLGIFDQKCFISVFLGKNFRNSIVMFEIIILKFVYFQNFKKKQKYLNLGAKMPDLAIFGLEFENNIVIFEISTLKSVYLQNFTKKQKCLILGPKVPDLGILGLEFENNIVIFEINTLEFI